MEEEERKKTCPFWKDECHTDCMMYIASVEKMTAKCAFTVIANQLEAATSVRTGRQGLGM